MKKIKIKLFVLSAIHSLFAFADTADQVRTIVKKLFPENLIILEVGAYTGGDTIKAAKLWPKATIYAFEPIPQIFDQLQANCKDFSHVHCFQRALNDATGKAKMFISSGSSFMSSSLLRPKEHLKYHPDVFFTRTIEVETSNLDEWAKQNNVDRIDLLWITMQGAEMEMLQAAPEMLKTVQAVYTEVHKYEVYAGCLLYPEMKKWFEARGFIAVVEELDRWPDFGNVLFIRKK